MRWDMARIAARTGLLVLLLILGACGAEQRSDMIGRPAPDFTLTMLDGGVQRLRDLKGTPVLLEFWAPWCSGCLQNIPALKQLHAEYGSRILFIAASAEHGRKTLDAFIKHHQLPYPVALSNQGALNAYRASAIPATVLIDAAGTIRYYHAGQFSAEVLGEKMREITAETWGSSSK